MSVEQMIFIFLVLDGPIIGALYLLWSKLRNQ